MVEDLFLSCSPWDFFVAIFNLLMGQLSRTVFKLTPRYQPVQLFGVPGKIVLANRSTIRGSI